MRIGSLFSGAGGLDMAVQSVFGGEIVWHSEIDKAASKVLEYRFPGVPNLGDITKINWANWKPMLEVDVLCGGFPCTDVSAAGKRAGMHGTRSGLWSHMAEAIDVLRPQFVVIENVRGLLNANANRPMESEQDAVGNPADRPVLRAIGAVLGDLADIGIYEARWVTVAASSVGAPHRRERVFIVATDATKSERRGTQQQLLGASIGSAAEPRERTGAGASRSGDAAVSGDEPGVALLPTPAAGNFNDGEAAEQWLARQAAVKERLNNGNGMGMPLAIAVQLLPTPRTSDTNGAGLHGDGGMDLRTTVTLLPTPAAADGNGHGQLSSPGHQTTLPGEVRLLPTPLATDGTDGPVTNCKSVQAICDGSAGRNPRLSEMAAGYLMPATAWGKYAPAITRWEQIVGPAPAPTEPNKNGNPRLSAAFSEWLMGWPAGWVTDPDIGISRNDQLRIVGNGVCPQQAASALRYLIAV